MPGGVLFPGSTSPVCVASVFVIFQTIPLFGIVIGGSSITPIHYVESSVAIFFLFMKHHAGGPKACAWLLKCQEL